MDSLKTPHDIKWDRLRRRTMIAFGVFIAVDFIAAGLTDVAIGATVAVVGLLFLEIKAHYREAWVLANLDKLRLAEIYRYADRLSERFSNEGKLDHVPIAMAMRHAAEALWEKFPIREVDATKDRKGKPPCR